MLCLLAFTVVISAILFGYLRHMLVSNIQTLLSNMVFTEQIHFEQCFKKFLPTLEYKFRAGVLKPTFLKIRPKKGNSTSFHGGHALSLTILEPDNRKTMVFIHKD